MPARITALCIDAVDPRRLAHFWAAALRWRVDTSSAGEVITLVPTDATSFSIDVCQVAEPKAVRNRIHLDLTTESLDDQRDTVAELLALGATHLDVGQSPDETHVVLADPEGNELCIIEPTNNFLSTCPRLGAVNCDGTRATGLFWSAALDWPLVWDSGEETAIQSPDGTGPKITWSGPPLLDKAGHKNRLHLDIAPVGATQADELTRLVGLGARRVDIGQGDVGWIVMADPDDNEFCLLQPTPP